MDKRIMNNKREIHELLRDMLLEPEDSEEPVCEATDDKAGTNARCDYCGDPIPIGARMWVLQEDEGKRRMYCLDDLCYNRATDVSSRQSRRG